MADGLETNESMISKLGLTNSKLENAFRKVDKALFLPECIRDQAYDDSPVKFALFHHSAPYLYALCALNIEPSSKRTNVLIIGSGTGYLATVLAIYLGKYSTIVCVDKEESLVEFARNTSDSVLRASASNSSTLTFIHGDAYTIDCNRNMVYDRIIICAGIKETSKSFFCKLLASDGILIAPIGSNYIKLKKTKDAKPKESKEDSVKFTETLLTKVSFVSLQGQCIDDELDAQFSLMLNPFIWQPNLFQYSQYSLHSTFTNTIHLVHLMSRRCRFVTANSSLPLLPVYMWYHVLSFCTRDWFYPVLSPYDLLLLKYNNERKIRKQLESNLEHVKEERDHAMTIALVMKRRMQQLGIANIFNLNGDADNNDDNDDNDNDNNDDGDDENDNDNNNDNAVQHDHGISNQHPQDDNNIANVGVGYEDMEDAKCAPHEVNDASSGIDMDFNESEACIESKEGM